jgi:hypothetical protein
MIILSESRNESVVDMTQISFVQDCIFDTCLFVNDIPLLFEATTFSRMTLRGMPHSRKVLKVIYQNALFLVMHCTIFKLSCCVQIAESCSG